MRHKARKSVLREPALFVLVGGGVACFGNVMLWWLIGIGWAAGWANALVAVATLQLNFLGSRTLTWRRRVARSEWSWSRRWRRFHVARGASAGLSALAFPFVAPVVGTTQAYWGLLGVAAAANYCSDRIWSFTPRIGTAGRVAMLIGAVLAVVAFAALRLDWFLVLVSVFMLSVATTTLVFQLYKWWRPEHNDPHRYGEPDTPRLPGVILVPMRHEEAVAGHTLERLATLNHPSYWVMPIVDHADDPRTADIAHAAAADHPDRVFVCPYPEDTDVHNKPVGLNAAVAMLHAMGIRFEWIGIADAEDVFHPDLLTMVDYRFRTTGAAIVQCGVQLMNFAAHPEAVPRPVGRLSSTRRWWKAQTSAWWRAANVLEYFKWFQSRLKLQAATRVMPLGGNTVFFRREFLESLEAHYGTWWDEDCLTEDCKIGMLASVMGFSIDVVYVDNMVTHEETPDTLAGFLRQRVRWMQGFIQVFFEHDWLRLPTVTQRVLAVYVLGFQFFQAFAALFAPVALALALYHKAPVAIALLATIPLALGVLSVILDVVLLHDFGRSFQQDVRLRDYVGLVLGSYPYQVLLSTAAVWALFRFALGRNNWVKTRHQGAHFGHAERAHATAAPMTSGALR